MDWSSKLSLKTLIVLVFGELWYTNNQNVILVLLETVVPPAIQSLCYLYWNVVGRAHQFYIKLLTMKLHFWVPDFTVNVATSMKSLAL